MSIRLGGSNILRQRARANHSTMLVDTAAIYRPGTPTPSSEGGTTSTFSLLGIEPAYFYSVQGNEALALQGMNVIASVIVKVPANTDVTEHDQLVYTVSETGAVHHFDISFVFERSEGLTTKLACSEIKFQP
jgi:hypothetical protein